MPTPAIVDAPTGAGSPRQVLATLWVTEIVKRLLGPLHDPAALL